MNLIKRYKPKLYLVVSFLSLAALSAGMLIWHVYNNRINNIVAYNKWLNDQGNGCISDNDIAGVHISVKYQPPAYLVMKQLQHTTGGMQNMQLRDSLLKAQGKLMTFLMTIAPAHEEDKAEAKSLMYNGVSNYAGYEQRVLDANFFMERYIKLYIDGVAFVPVLSAIDNVYELSEGRSFMIVFAPLSQRSKLTTGNDYLFVYSDPFFSMGKVQFDFSGAALATARAANVVWQ